MALLKRGKKSLVSPNIEVLVVPLVLFAVLVVLFLLVGKIGVSKISSQRQKLSTARKDEMILKQKQEVLQDLKGEVLSMADVTAIAMPERNPALVVISQLKNLAASKVVILSNLKIGSRPGDKKGMSRVEIAFDVDGDFSQVMDFLQDLDKIAPLLTIDRVKINQIGGGSRANTTLVAFWAPYPTKLPPLTEPLSSLSAEEKDLITNLSELVPPVFTEMAPSAPSERTDPFSP